APAGRGDATTSRAALRRPCRGTSRVDGRAQRRPVPGRPAADTLLRASIGRRARPLASTPRIAAGARAFVRLPNRDRVQERLPREGEAPGSLLGAPVRVYLLASGGLLPRERSESVDRIAEDACVRDRKMNVDGSPVGGAERSEVPERLRQLQGPECETVVRNLHVYLWRGGDQNENACVGPALVQLPGRVEVARSEPEHRGRTCATADHRSEVFERARQLRVWTEISQYCQVVGCLQEGQH